MRALPLALALLLVPALLLPLAAPAAEARPGWWCGNWGYGGHSSIDVECQADEYTYCDVWTYDGTCWQLW